LEEANKSTNVTKWLGMRLRAMFRPLPGQIFDNKSRNHNEFKSLFLLLHSLAHLNELITLTWPPMVEITLAGNINVSNVVILPTLNRIVPSTSVEPADKQHLDMHQRPVKDVCLMMESADTTMSMDTMMATSQESADIHMLFMYVYLSTI
jgi:hypothetical protein